MIYARPDTNINVCFSGKGYADITHLITIPTLSMVSRPTFASLTELSLMLCDKQGLGDLILIPLALAIGRRPVYLFSGALLFIACIIASQNTSYEVSITLFSKSGDKRTWLMMSDRECFAVSSGHPCRSWHCSRSIRCTRPPHAQGTFLLTRACECSLHASRWSNHRWLRSHHLRP